MKSEVRRVFRRISQDPELKYFKRAAVTDTINNMRQIIGANSWSNMRALREWGRMAWRAINVYLSAFRFDYTFALLWFAMLWYRLFEFLWILIAFMNSNASFSFCLRFWFQSFDWSILVSFRELKCLIMFDSAWRICLVSIWLIDWLIWLWISLVDFLSLIYESFFALLLCHSFRFSDDR